MASCGGDLRPQQSDRALIAIVKNEIPIPPAKQSRFQERRAKFPSTTLFSSIISFRLARPMPTSTYLVTLNDYGQQSIWPAHRPLPEGWKPAGPSGSREECLAYIDGHWPALPPAHPAALSADRSETVLALFRLQAVQTPDAVAIAAGERRLTYAELAGRVAALAGELRRRGAGPEVPVGLEMDRSPELVIAILGVLWAGGAYVPIDPEYPADRKEFMRADSQISLLLTQHDVAELSTGTANAADAPLPDPASLAYVIYTSGSTGRPKGVGIDHFALVRRVMWMRERFALGPGDHMYQHAAVSFDAHAEEIFPCLTTGATLVLPPPGKDLPDLLAEGTKITVLDLPTSYWQGLAGSPWPEELRLVILGADPLRGQALAGWYAEMGDTVEVINTYGPTEATIIASAATITRAEAGGRPPIGHPLSDTRLHVLDRELELVEPGTPGELCIGGLGLARGYLGQPALTAQAFVPDPFGAPGERLYRSGDLVRARPDGALEFLGRLDGQVKVRGFRVEPGEIEIRLLEHPAVERAIVVARNDGLDAYLILAVDVSSEELAAHVSSKLPSYMVPNTFTFLDAFPLTRSGKIDRSALHAPAPAAAPGQASPGLATPTEEAVAEIWAELFGLDRVTPDDDFFALGGHSLLATKAIVWLTPVVGQHIPLRALYETRTLRSFAAHLDELKREKAER
ncbi:amino acid adenylation domain-containing protein [Nonomuraea sp. NPDC050328]|uniref:amino acid adenylation domain-containing protein n=1 Tax=Nonomuraea sp. NPDC050328 TaxID=3364361 RepID=UPI0037A4DDD1